MYSYRGFAVLYMQGGVYSLEFLFFFGNKVRGG